MTGQMRRCEACAAPQDDGRVLCAQCGVDLDSPDAPLVWPLRVDEASAGQSRGRTTRARGMLIGAGIVLVVAALAAGAFLSGWFANDTAVDVMPAAQQATSVETSRAVAEIGTVRQGGLDPNPHDAQVLVDADRDDAWFGDVPALGFVARESVVLRLEEPAWISRLVLANGVHQDLAAYDAHGRARSVEIVFDGDVAHTATLLDIGRLRQQVVFDTPVLTTSVKLTILAVYPGQEHRDVALSGVELRGYDPTPAQQARATEQALRAPAVDTVS